MTSPEFSLSTISCSIDRGVAVVRFDRPDRGNAWTSQMQRDYRRVMAELQVAPEVRVVVLTGAGRAFCVGGDMDSLAAISESGAFTPQQADPLADELFGTDLGSFAFVLRMSKPVIAAINGPAAGVGFVIAAFCDLRYAAAGAKLTVAMPRLGLPAEQGLSWILPRLVGIANAADLLLTGAVVRAEQALEMGLVQRVFPHDDLLEAVLEQARTIAAEIAPSSLEMMKRQLYADLASTLPEAVATADSLTTRALTGNDYREGISAFAERRRPRF